MLGLLLFKIATVMVNSIAFLGWKSIEIYNYLKKNDITSYNSQKLHCIVIIIIILGPGHTKCNYHGATYKQSMYK